MSLDALDSVFTRLTEEVDRVTGPGRTTGSEPAALGPGEPVTGRGSALDGRVTMTVTNGRVTGCELAPQVLRLTNVELAEHLVEAANAALDGYTAALTTAIRQSQPDLSTLAGRVREIQADAQSSLSRYTADLAAMLRSRGVE